MLKVYAEAWTVGQGNPIPSKPPSIVDYAITLPSKVFPITFLRAEIHRGRWLRMRKKYEPLAGGKGLENKLNEAKYFFHNEFRRHCRWLQYYCLLRFIVRYYFKLIDRSIYIHFNECGNSRRGMRDKTEHFILDRDNDKSESQKGNKRTSNRYEELNIAFKDCAVGKEIRFSKDVKLDQRLS